MIWNHPVETTIKKLDVWSSRKVWKEVPSPTGSAKIGRNSNCPHFLHVGSKASPRCWLATVEFLWAITIRIYKKRLRRHFGWISITQVFLKWGKRLWQNKQPTHSGQMKIRVLVLGDSKRRPVVFWADRYGGPSSKRKLPQFHGEPFLEVRNWQRKLNGNPTLWNIRWERRDPLRGSNGLGPSRRERMVQEHTLKLYGN